MTIVLEPVDLHAAARSLAEPLAEAGAKLVFLGPDAPPPPAPLAENAAVVAPADDRELAALLPWLSQRAAPTWVLVGGPRLWRVHAEEAPFTPDQGEVLLPGDDVCVLACGAQVGEALAAAMDLHTQSIHTRVVSLSTLTPLCAEALSRAVTGCDALLVAEAPVPPGLPTLHRRITEALADRDIPAVPAPATPSAPRARAQDALEDTDAGADADADMDADPTPFGPRATDIRVAVTRRLRQQRGPGAFPTGTP